ncbi:transcriptional regulator, TetR family [Salegentibacter holothuriorum]|uniref:Transcriptional regulator, TetR family n=1 Tax=Salegentibacter holothuriorum TaxID=241145 RepID=A0A1T5EAU6_9FLAO|nr:TetR/AcrR family transcriptional regulator [Salegentibacter holothuriorum]SKB80815.1 transcriptional regulator, TetR family [Salegentibacter holothuriorum]
MGRSKVRDRIVETASKLFYKNGYNSTGVNEIISESGIAKATLYNHFKSKDDICIAFLDFKHAAFMEDIEAFTKDRNEGVDQILALFDYLQLFFQDSEFNGCWGIKTVAEIPQNNQKIRTVLQGQKREFLDLIIALVTKNLKIDHQEEIKTTARRIYLLYESAVVESHLHQNDWPIKEAKEVCSQIII